MEKQKKRLTFFKRHKKMTTLIASIIMLVGIPLMAYAAKFTAVEDHNGPNDGVMSYAKNAAGYPCTATRKVVKGTDRTVYCVNHNMNSPNDIPYETSHGYDLGPNAMAIAYVSNADLHLNSAAKGGYSTDQANYYLKQCLISYLLDPSGRVGWKHVANAPGNFASEYDRIKDDAMDYQKSGGKASIHLVQNHIKFALKGNYYESGWCDVQKQGNVSVSSTIEGAPAGTKFVDQDGDVHDGILKSTTKFYLRVPKASVTKNVDGIKVVASAKANVASTSVFKPLMSGGYQNLLNPEGFVNASSQDYTLLDLQYAPEKGNINVTKVDDNNKALAGAVMGLFQGDKKIAEATTDANGHVSFTGLMHGDYTVKELKAPEGYVVAPNQNVKVEAAKTASLTFKDSRFKAELKVVKVDSKTHKPLNGCTFALLQNGKQIKTAVTTGNGFAVFADVPYGTYQIKEIAAPKGYKLSDKVLTANIKPGQEVITKGLKMEDEMITGKVEISKVDVTTSKELSGAQIEVKCIEGVDKGKVIKFTSADKPKTIDLNYGKYEYKEVVAPKGYNLNTTVGTFEIKNNGQVIKCQIKDTPISGKVEISKVDITNDKELPGAQIEVKCTEGKDIGKVIKFTSGNQPKTIDLLYGKYEYKEVVAPKGYNLNTNVGTFEIKNNGEIIKCKIKDTPITGDIEIIKQDISTGKVLPNTIFAIYDEKGNVVAKDVTDKNGMCKFHLGYGKYFYQEVKAPEGYDILNDKYPFEITEQGQVVKAVMKDTKLPKTGDVNSKLPLMGGVVGLSIAGIVALLFVKKH